MTDWQSWNRHVDYIIDTQGAWYGIGDGDGAPLLTLPGPLEESAPKVWMSREDMTITIPAAGEHGLHVVAGRLVSPRLIKIGPDGRMIPATDEELTFLTADRGPNGTVIRRGGVISHADADDPSNTGAPETITIYALDLMDVWHSWPAPSWPLSWWETTIRDYTTDESGVDYTTARHMGLVEMATRADGYTKFGPAETVIRELVQESLDAAAKTQTDPDGTPWVDRPHHIIDLVETGRDSPDVYIEVRDEYLWDTVSTQASNAGVLLGYRLWWPGDPPIRSYELAHSDMSVEQVNLSPPDGSQPHRQVVEQTFDRPMVVLTANQL